jgi:hypothetical protein
MPYFIPRNSRGTKLFSSVKELFKRCRLFCSRHSVLRNRVIGLDLLNIRLLYLQLNKNNSTCVEIRLRDLEDCTVKKQYTPIGAGSLRNNGLHEYLKSISLVLYFKNGRQSIGIPFYEKKKDRLYHLSELEAKARSWQTTVLKLMQK